MAGEWFQHDCLLRDKPEVQRIMQLSGDTLRETVGSLSLFWAWVQLHAVETDDPRLGIVPNCDLLTLSQHCGGSEKFWKAVERVGWLVVHDSGIVIPGFGKRFSKAAKLRLQANERQALYRERKREQSGPNEPPTPEQQPDEDENGPSKPTRSRPCYGKSVFDSLTLADLTNTRKLLEWCEWAASQPRPVIQETHFMYVFAAAERATRVKQLKDPFGFFCKTVGKHNWTILEPGDIQLGQARLRTCTPQKQQTMRQYVNEKTERDRQDEVLKIQHWQKRQAH